MRIGSARERRRFYQIDFSIDAGHELLAFAKRRAFSLTSPILDKIAYLSVFRLRF
jgi:hypothetical protein